MLFDTLLATEKDYTIAKILLLCHACTFTFRIGLRCLNLRPRALRLMTDESKSIDLDLFTLDKRGRALDDKFEDGCISLECKLQLFAIIIKLHILTNQ